MKLSEEWRPYDNSVMFVDPSGRGKDECAWVICKSQGTNLYLVSEGGHRLGYSTLGLETLYQEAQKHQVNLVLLESNFGDGMFTQLLTSHFAAKYKDGGYTCTIEEVRSSKQKELRIIDTLSLS